MIKYRFFNSMVEFVRLHEFEEGKILKLSTCSAVR